MRFSLVPLVACLICHEAAAGTITGVVRARGPAAQDDSAVGAYASKKYMFADRTDYSAIHDFVVYIDGPIGGTKPPTELSQVMQKGVEFVPHILPVMVGTWVKWPNEDKIFHNVFSKSPGAQFNLGLYKKGDEANITNRVQFVKPGEVDVFCAIHAKMSCIILVLENPYFDATDDGGRYTITNVPPGTYTLVGWQERLFSQKKQITVPATGDLKVDFVLSPDPKP